MAVYENKLDELFSAFCQSRYRFETASNGLGDVFKKRLIYYCKSRKWIEDVFGLQWQSGLNLRQLLTPHQEAYIISEHLNPANKVYAGGKLQYHFVFCAVSPVIQRFISFRLWPEQVPRARDFVVEVRKTINQRKISLVKMSGSIGLYWPHTDLRLQRGNAKIIDAQLPENALARIILIPGLHHEARDLTWWRCFSDYSTYYIAADEKPKFMSGGICIAKLDQKLTKYCQLKILGDNIRWSGQIYRFRYAGYRAQEMLGNAGSIYSVLYLREFDEKTGKDHFWMQDIVEATPMDILLHLIMRHLNHIYQNTARLRLIKVEELETMSTGYLSQISRILVRGRQEKREAGFNIPMSFVVKVLLSGYYRDIDGTLFFVPPGMQDKTNTKIKELDNQLAELYGKQSEKREFYREFLDDDDLLKTAFLTWLMARINSGCRPWIPPDVGKDPMGIT